MIWDRADDAFDDNRYGTVAELAAEIAALEQELLRLGCPRDRFPPEVPITGTSLASPQSRRFGRKLQLQSLLERYRQETGGDRS